MDYQIGKTSRWTILVILLLGLGIGLTKINLSFSSSHERDPKREALIQPAPAAKSRNEARLEAEGVKYFRNDLGNFKPAKVFPEGIHGFDHFKEIMDTFQPADKVCTAGMSDSDCEDLRMANTAKTLSFAALGWYQILLRWHGHYIPGWEGANWKERFELMYKFMSDPELQRQVSKQILMKKLGNTKGDVARSGSQYYGRDTKGGLWNRVRSLFPEKVGGSSSGYGDFVQRCYEYQVEHGWTPPSEDSEVISGIYLDLMVFCIGEKETCAWTSDKHRKCRY